MTPIVLETTIRLPDVISMTASLGVVISTVLWVRSTLARHEVTLFNEKGESRLVPISLSIARHDTALFNEKGEPRLVSFEAHYRMQTACRKELTIETSHSVDQMQKLTEVIAKLTEEVSRLSRCVSILSAGGKADGC